MNLTWRDAAEAMLEGAGILGPYKGNYFDSMGEPTQACAQGCAHYAAVKLHDAVRLDTILYYAASGPDESIVARRVKTYMVDDDDPWRSAIRELTQRYFDTYHAHVAAHNDEHGRDYVLANVKEMLNQPIGEET